MKVQFWVTLTGSEWSARSSKFREYAHNVGLLTSSECPSFYLELDAAVFPSLLEASSSMPLEALQMRVPLFASDRAFVRSVVGNAARYFDPESPESAAEVIAATFSSPGQLEGMRRRGDAVISGWPTARDRALRYLEVIEESMEG